MYLYKLWQKFKGFFKQIRWDYTISSLATLFVLFVVVLYTGYYIIYYKGINLIIWLKDEEKKSALEIAIYIIKNPKTYAEFATWATLLGLLHLLEDNWRKYRSQ